MSEFVRWFLSVQVMAAAGWFTTVMLCRLALPASTVLRVSRVLMLAALALPVAVASVALKTPFSPELQMWALLERAGVAPATLTLSPKGVPSFWESLPALPDQPWPVLLYGSVLLACGWSMHSWRSLQAIVDRATPHEVDEGVEILVSEETEVPFAVALFARRLVVVDPLTIEEPEDYRVAVLHERQHHRQRDPAFAYLSILIRSLCVINPFAHAWVRRVGELEEFACDEGVLRSGAVTAKAYGRTLLRTARRLAGHQASLPLSVGLMSGGVSLLQRRLQRMANRREQPPRFALMLVVAMTGMTVAAWIADGLIVGPGLSHGELVELAEQREGFDIAPPEDDLFFVALRELGGRPDGLRFVRRALFRGQDDLAMVEAELVRRQLPRELRAVPLVESGFHHFVPEKPGEGAGIWRLSAPMARAYGLVVNDVRDERYDPEACTGAALDLLEDLHTEFGSWDLALAAYREGRFYMHGLVDEDDTMSAWDLVMAKRLHEYPAVVLSASVLIDHQGVLDRRRAPSWRTTEVR